MPAIFQLCQDLVGPEGVIANIGVHGQKVDLHLERLWSQKWVEPRAEPLIGSSG